MTTDRVELVCSGLRPELATDIEEHRGGVLRSRGEYVEISLAEKQGDEVLAQILASGGSILSVTPRRQSLEDVFLNAVEEGARSGAEMRDTTERSISQGGAQ